MPEPVAQKLPATVDRIIPQSWTDYIGYLSEAHYLEASAQATG
ncbi:hypothetical protein ACXYMP_09905 [Aliiroseovarius sp. CAU 1755]